MSLKYNKSDVRHAKEIFLQLRDEDVETGERGCETAMFSFGYADVWFDGAVVAHGGVVFELDADDGDLVETDDGDSEE